jgi:hypothetical protein
MESFVDAAYPRPTANNVGFVHLIRVLSKMIGTVRRECLDRVLVFGEVHLREILSSYAMYYNEVRTHLALGKRKWPRSRGHFVCVDKARCRFRKFDPAWVRLVSPKHCINRAARI